MRRKLSFSAGVIVALAGVVCAQAAQQQTQDNRNPLSTAGRTEAHRIAEGRDLTVRIYPDLESDPDRSVLVKVPIRNLAIRFSAIKEAYPSITEAAHILIRAEDQSDDDLAAILNRYVCLLRYTQHHTQSIWFATNREEYNPWWTFFDALGEPMAGASVQIELMQRARRDAGSMLRIHLGTGVLDENGRLASLQVMGGPVTMRIEHPDYGIASVRAVRNPKDRAGIYVVPMVPRNSEAFSSSLSGTVADSNGQPVADVPVFFSLTGPSEDDSDCYNRLFDGRAVTNEQGWFSLCRPKLSKDLVLDELPGPGTPYVVMIEPPKALNLRHLSGTVHAGTPAALTLTQMTQDEAFHTFSFTYPDGSALTQEDLKNTVLTLYRNQRKWRWLRYDDFKNGCFLPAGTLSSCK